MAGHNSLLLEDTTLVWHTGLPTEGEPTLYSPTFSFGGAEWLFRFVFWEDDGNYHIISLHRINEDGTIPEEGVEMTDVEFKVEAYMKHLTEPGKVVINIEEDTVWKDFNVDFTLTYLWWCGKDRENVFKMLDWLRERPEVKFACRFPTPPTIHPLPIQTGGNNVSRPSSGEEVRKQSTLTPES